MPHFLDLASAGAPALRVILAEAHRRKAARSGLPKGMTDADAPLSGHTLAMIFEKPSTRTRFSFDMGIRQLGGSSIVTSNSDMQLGRGETIADTARVIGRMVDAVMLRTADHGIIEALAAASPVPVINGLTDASHPCQLIADIMTVEEALGRPIAGSHWAWLGDGNNMTHSLIEAASLLDFSVSLGVPEGYDCDPAVLAAARTRGGRINLSRDAAEAAAGADVIVTDTWVSMGQTSAEAKLKAMMPFQVNAALMAKAKPDAIFLHCLPAHREEEVTGEVMDGPQSRVWDEAENRLHAQKAILLWCLAKL